MAGRGADWGYDRYYFSLLKAQRMSFIRFLLYGWILGVPGWVLFILLSPFVWLYYVFYTFSFKVGGKVTGRWLKFNTRRAFGAYIRREDREEVEKKHADN
jgi:hypothetical protein